MKGFLKRMETIAIIVTGIISVAMVLSGIAFWLIGYFILGIVIVTLAWYNVDLRSKISSLRKKPIFPHELMPNFFGVLLYILDLKKDREFADDKFHRFTLRGFHLRVKGSDSFYTEYMKGINVSGKPSLGIPLKITGHAPMPVSAMKIKAIIKKRGEIEKLPDPEIKVDKSYKKILFISFRKPLPDKKHFNVEVSCKWCAHITEENSYCYLVPTHQTKGTDRGQLKLTLDRPLKEQRIYKYYIKEKKLILTEETLDKIDEKNYKYNVKSPNLNEIYIVQFTRE